MKRRLIAITAALPVLLALIIIAPNAGAAPPDPPPSLVEISGYSRTDSNSNISSAGSTASFNITVKFPSVDSGGITQAQLEGLTVTLGKDFIFASGKPWVKPFLEDLTEPPESDKTSAEFTLALVYTGPGNFLEITLTHPSSPAGSDDHSTTWQFHRNDTLTPEPYNPPSYDYTPPSVPIPTLSVSGKLPELEAGKSGRIEFTLTNTSTTPAQAVTVTLLETSDTLFRPTAISGSSISVGTLGVGGSSSRSVIIPVDIFDDVPEGYYNVPIKITFRNSAGDNATHDTFLQVFIKNPLVGGKAGKPFMSVASATVNKNTPGSDGILMLTMVIANIGDGGARDARVSLTGFKSSEITLNESLATKSLGDVLSEGRSTVTYSLKVAKDLESGTYPLNVEVRYKLPDNTEASMTDVVYINIIQPTASQSSVQLVGVSQDVSNPGNSNIIKVTLTVKNNSGAKADDVTVGFGGLSATSFTLSGSFGDSKLGSIDPNSTASVTIALYVSESLPNGNYPLPVVIGYSDSGAAGAKAESTETEVFIFVNRPEKDSDEESDGSVPRVIISRHSISVDTVIAGKPFELSATLLNTSMSKNIKNLKVTVTDKDGIFIPVEGTNSFYIAEIPIGQTTDITIMLAAKQDAETKSYPVSISLDYEDEKNTPYSVTESLSIPVYLPQRLEVSNVTFYESGMGMGYLSFQFINKGKSPLYNMNIRIDGPMTAMEGDYFIGTFGQGQSDYFEDTIIVSAYGELEGFIVLEFEDSAGNPQELREPIFAYISEPFYPEPGFPGEGEWSIDPGFPGDPGFGMDEGGGSLPGWALWTIIGGGAIIVTITTVVIVRKARHKKLNLEDDAYADSQRADLED